MERAISPLAGQKPKPEELITAKAMGELYYNYPGPFSPIKNGTSGHRGLTGAGFSDRQVAALTQALVDLRKERGTFGPDQPERFVSRPLGPIIMGKDVRFTSDFAQRTAAEVLAGNGMNVVIHQGQRATPTPVISHTLLADNIKGKSEGIIITASHNPPEEAGMKSNGLDGGPNTRTVPIDELANYYLENPQLIKRLDYETAQRQELIKEIDLVTPYVKDLGNVVRMEIIRKVKFGATPLGGSAHGYYRAINEAYGTRIEEILSEPDPASANRTYDWDGKLRGDPSSEYVMQAVAGWREKLAVPFIGANDNDADRFGGEDASGILNPNHILCVIADYLAANRGFASGLKIGRTIGTTHMLDAIAQTYGRLVEEVNVGFKYYVAGLRENKYLLAGEESAGLSLPRLNGTTWVTEKDGICAVLLLMEIIAFTGKNIGTLYQELDSKYGPYQYERIDTPATPQKKYLLQQLAKNPSEVKARLEGKKIVGKAIERLAIGDGIKVVLADGIWVLKRASGTEDIIKDYREEKGESLALARKASVEIDSYLGLADI